MLFYYEGQLHKRANVKLAYSTSPFKFRQVNFPQKNVKKTDIEIDKMCFSPRET